MKPQAFGGLRDLERAFAEFDQADGYPHVNPKYAEDWHAIPVSSRLDYAKSLNNFSQIVTNGKFPQESQFVVLCALYVYGLKAVEYWRQLRDHYCRGKPRGSHAITDEALDLWYATDAWIQAWLYSPASSRRPSTNSPSEWLRCIGSNDPTPHLRMSHAFLRQAGLRLPGKYSTARRNLSDVKGMFQQYSIMENGAEVTKIGPLIQRFPLVPWDIWQRAVYLLTNDIKLPSHFPIFGWRQYQVLDYVRRGRLLVDPETEASMLGHPASLHGILWPQQMKTLRENAKLSTVRIAAGPPVNSGRMLRRQSAH